MVLALMAFIALAGGMSHLQPLGRPAAADAHAPSIVRAAADTGVGGRLVIAAPALAASTSAGASDLPGGGRQVFAGNRFLVAYYGTARSGALGVLGEASPDRIMPRLLRAAAPFARGGRTVVPVFELIVTVAHRSPGPSGTYSSNIRRADVQRYIGAAHRHGALLVLDLQPGRADFLDVARTWRWALKDPWVGLALDPEWRMGPTGVPGRRVGSVSAAEVNRVSAWVDQLTARAGLPEKVFLLHEFRTDMVRHLERIVDRDHLALVQHVDGFGTPAQKLDTFHAVVRPRQFALGFKLFYDEDTPRMRAAQVLRIRPRISYVSFQ